jgi:2,4-dienoyl-CoA reductase-like NADH-dependent reductase (Old Yellow Enzyme family)
MTASQLDVLFKPFQLKNLQLKNRIVMAPMTRSFSPEGVPGDNVADYYRRRAEAQVGLIISEGTAVNRPASRNEPGIPYFYGEQALAGWKKVIDSVHQAGGTMAPQIWHVGAVASPYTEWTPDAPPESPSGLVAPGTPRGKAMSEADIADSIAAFAQAAADAKRLGFDTVEIHGAHGYLIDQFFWSETNQRSDNYGGASIRERSRFAVELIKSVRAAVGPDFPITLRVSQWKQQDYAAKLAHNPAELTQWLGPLVEAGVDILHCSQRRYWEAEFPELDGEQGLNFAGWAKKVTGAATISVGSVGDVISAFSGEKSTPVGLDNLVARMEREEFDLIAVGRAILSDPQWAAKIHANDHENLHDFDPATLTQLV